MQPRRLVVGECPQSPRRLCTEAPAGAEKPWGGPLAGTGSLQEQLLQTLQPFRPQGPAETERKATCISALGNFLGRWSNASIRFSEASLTHRRERTVVTSCNFDPHT